MKKFYFLIFFIFLVSYFFVFFQTIYADSSCQGVLPGGGGSDFVSGGYYQTYCTNSLRLACSPCGVGDCQTVHYTCTGSTLVEETCSAYVACYGCVSNNFNGADCGNKGRCLWNGYGSCSLPTCNATPGDCYNTACYLSDTGNKCSNNGSVDQYCRYTTYSGGGSCNKPDYFKNQTYTDTCPIDNCDNSRSICSNGNCVPIYTISGHVYNDPINPKDKEPESRDPVNGVTVRLDGAGTTAVTDDNGYYFFKGILFGTQHSVTVISVPNDKGYGNHTSIATFSVNSDSPNKNLWVIPTKIAGMIYLVDPSTGACNGTTLAPNIGTNNISIAIGGHNFTPTPINGGGYSFDTIQYPGSYTISLNLTVPNHYALATGSGCGSYPGSRTINLSPYDDSSSGFAHQNFYITPMNIGGNLFWDSNRDGNWGSDSPLVSDINGHAITVWAWGPSNSGHNISDIADSSGGYYISNLWNENYTINTGSAPSGYYDLGEGKSWKQVKPSDPTANSGRGSGHTDLLFEKYTKIDGQVYVDDPNVNGGLGDCLGARGLVPSTKEFSMTSPDGSWKYIGGGYEVYNLKLGTHNVSIVPSSKLNYKLSSCNTFSNTSSRSISTSNGDVPSGSTTKFYIVPPGPVSINGTLCMSQSGDPDCSSSPNNYTGTGSAKVYRDNDSGPCDEIHDGDCKFETRTFLLKDPTHFNEILEGVTSNGKYWSWDMGGGSPQSGFMDQVPRWASGPCSGHGALHDCAFDTRTFVPDASGNAAKELITAGGTSWSWEIDSAGNYTPDPLQDMHSITRWAGPCAVKNCVFDTRTYYYDFHGTLVEQITVNGKIWAFNGNLPYTDPDGIISGTKGTSINGLDIYRANSRYIAANSPCKNDKGITRNPCIFDTQTYYRDNSNYLIESVTAYGKVWAWNEGTGVISVNGLNLSDVDRWSNSPLPTSAVPPPLDSYNTAGILSITPSASYWANINLTDSRYKITYPNPTPGVDTTQCNSNFSSCRKKITSAPVGPVTQNFSVWCQDNPNHCHSISGFVFVDNGANPVKGKKEADEGAPPQTLNPTITITDSTRNTVATLTSGSGYDLSNGSYSYDGLVDGETYTVTASDIGGYYFTAPPAQYTVNFGSTCLLTTLTPNNLDGICDVDVSTGHTNAITLNFGIDLTKGWEQYACGDAYQAPDNFHIPATCSGKYPMNDNATFCPTVGAGNGIAISGEIFDSTKTYGSPKNWKVEGQPYVPSAGFHGSYEDLWNKSNGTAPTVIASDFGATFSKGHGIYQSGDLTISGSAGSITFRPGNYIFLVNGDLTISSKINVPSGVTVTFAVKSNITVTYGVGEDLLTPDSAISDIDGFYIADGDFRVESSIGGVCSSSGGTDRRLNISGTVIVNANKGGGQLVNSRVLCGDSTNYCNPSFTITQRPDFILNAPEFLETKGFTWQEVAP